MILQHGWRGCRYGDSYNAWKTMHRFAQLNARKFENKFHNSVIHTSRKHSDEIVEVSQSRISKVIITIRRIYSERYFLQSWDRTLIWIIIDFIKK